MLNRATPGDHLAARQMFASMPEDVFRAWLDGRIEANGWPPVGRTWEAALGLHSIAWWQQLQWLEEDVELRFDRMTPATQRIVQGLIDSTVNEIPNAFSEYLDNSFPRMQSIIAYGREYGGLPPGLVFLEVDGLLDVVEGCHRLAVHFLTVGSVPPPIELRGREIAWIGRHPMGV